MKRRGVFSGLGDRIGNYLIYATIGEIKNKIIYTTWVKTTYSDSHYPDNIHDYIQFPSTLNFVSDDDFDDLDFPTLNYSFVFHAFDYIPQTIYKTLIKEKIIDCSFVHFNDSYKKMCNQLKYLKKLPDGFNKRYGMIHLRRADKGNNKIHGFQIIHIISKFKNKTWIISSDNISHTNIYKKLNINVFKPKWSKNNKIKNLEQFFFYKYASIIIQSVPGLGKFGGWSAFSYIPFQLGIAKFNEKKPLLISCSSNKQNTRFTYARKFTNYELDNIFMFDEFYFLTKSK